MGLHEELVARGVPSGHADLIEAALERAAIQTEGQPRAVYEAHPQYQAAQALLEHFERYKR